MTNRIAIWLLVVIVAAIAGDFAVTGGQFTLAIARAFVNFVEWLAFWR